MPERQPGRPTEDEFIGAAVRFLNDDYQIEPIHLMSGYFVNVCKVPIGKTSDMDIIRREQSAEGRFGEPESLGDFAIKQLSLYQKARKR